MAINPLELKPTDIEVRVFYQGREAGTPFRLEQNPDRRDLRGARGRNLD